ncbi:preprotein translocase subunit SecG [Roseovarius aestuariivivens]|uniref:preprotein translocase subunit SecG n=1 Tax=Roseovarius aestuariivivens TaxID=1888910 RepID=UPI0010806871|nr:preprotein translocase subunit SecG [Roseovarius aestuariivivens]
MQNVILLVHLLLTLALIGVVLLQRSEGGGLGMGGGGNVATGRSAGTALGKMTWILGFALFATSLTLTIIAAQNSGGASVLDRITDAPAPVQAPDGAPGLPATGEGLLPPSAGDDAPLTPTAD